jgi:hypothetical protein
MPSRMSLRTLITPQVRLTGCCFACVCVVQQSCLHADREKDTQANTCSTQQNALLYRWVPGACSPGSNANQGSCLIDGGPYSQRPSRLGEAIHRPLRKARPLPMLPISISNRKTSLPGNTQCLRLSLPLRNRAQEEATRIRGPYPSRSI